MSGCALHGRNSVRLRVAHPKAGLLGAREQRSAESEAHRRRPSGNNQVITTGSQNGG